MSINFNASGATTDTFSPDDLVVGGPLRTRSITLEQYASATGDDYVRGALLNVDVDGKYHLISNTVTTVALNTTGEVLLNNAAGTETILVKYLAAPPLPGTVTIASTADGSATPVVAFGTDNGEGEGKGAGGSFTVDYETGRVVINVVTALTATHDVKAGYQYRAVEAADSGETQTAMPKAILAETVTDAAVIAGDVVVTAYIGGQFASAAIPNYSSAYRRHLRRLGIDVRDAYTY